MCNVIMYYFLFIDETRKAYTGAHLLAKLAIRECDAMFVTTLDTTSKQRSRSFILVPIDSSYMTSYGLSIVIFALGRTV